MLTGYQLPKNIDAYAYLAKLYFSKQEVDETDIASAKQITFRQLYGGIQKQYEHIKYYSHLKDFIANQWSFFNERGYIETPLFNRKISKIYIQMPKPATVFNYLLQAVEGEISIPLVGKINEYLRNKRSKAVLYTYDSILFDYSFDDGTDVLGEVRKIMSLDDTFPTKVYIGDNYHDMELLAV